MLSSTTRRCISGLRWNSSFNKLLTPKLNEINELIRNSKRKPNEYIENISTKFGKLVASDENSKSVVLDRDAILDDKVQSSFRNDSGHLLRGKNAEEARLLHETLQGRSFRDQIKLNPIIEQAISNNILSLHIPNNLRRVAANYYVELYNTKLHRQTKTPMEVDAHIASIFVQNYASIYQCLTELQKRLGVKNFNPKRVLDVGFGPATGIVALNDLLGKDYRPELKEAVILGNLEMEKRAKIILSRQLNEIPIETTPETDDIEQELRLEEEINNEELLDDIVEGDDLVGEVMTKKIKIVSKLRNNIPGSNQYDLVILTHQLLKNEEQFPIQVDHNIEHYLHMLAPGGHILVVERGNPLGFECIARARQVMIRPENFPDEHGKIPRPFLRGSSLKKTRLTNNTESEDTLDEELQFEPEVLKAIREMNSKGEEVNVNNLDYHLKIIAPCSHHRKCPLQIGKPSYYNFKESSKLKFCNYQKNLIRPKFSIELKKGKLLATPWQEPSLGMGIKGLAKPGTGRPNGNNYEVSNYSYLIAERSMKDQESIDKINKQREDAKGQEYGIGSLGDNTQDTWPRIINQPSKSKGHVSMDLCSSAGAIEKWVIPKSFSKAIYHDARKSMKGDLWGLECKTKRKGMGNFNVDKFAKLEKERIRELKRQSKRESDQLHEMYTDKSYDVRGLSNIYGDDFEQTNTEKKLRGKKKYL